MRDASAPAPDWLYNPGKMGVWTKILGAAVLMGTMGLASCQGLLATIQAAH